MEESKGPAPDEDASADVGEDEVSPDVSTLIAMGFARDRAEAALAGAQGSFDHALEQLLGRSRRPRGAARTNEMSAAGGDSAGAGASATAEQFSVGMAVCIKVCGTPSIPSARSRL